MKRALLLLAVFAAGCTETTPAWQLEHDRVIAVRATPPHIPSGERSNLDVLITAIGDGPSVVEPMVVQGPPGFEDLVVHDEDGWGVISPDEASLAAARTQLGLDADAPVPFEIGLAVMAGDSQLAAIKTVYLGDTGDNPELGDVTIAGMPATDDMVVPIGMEVELTIDADEMAQIDWLSSVGELTDITDTVGHLDAKDPFDGYVAVVKRDHLGGVVWGYWTVSAQ